MRIFPEAWRAAFATRDQAQPLLEHLEEFRRLLIHCLGVLAIGIVVCIPLAKPLVRWLQAPLLRVAEKNQYTFELITTSPVEGFLQLMKVVLAGGVLVSLPFMVMFAARFIFPGLKPAEQKHLVQGGVAGAGLFILGVAFGYLLTLPVAVKVMFTFNNYLGTTANWKIDSYLGFTLQLLIGFGLAFELPLLLLLLGRLGIVSPAQLRQYRRHVIVGILVVAMVLTPPDVPSQLQMAIPLWLLYELCVLILSLRERGGRRPEEGNG